jgi:hypothetical protein
MMIPPPIQYLQIEAFDNDGFLITFRNKKTQEILYQAACTDFDALVKVLQQSKYPNIVASHIYKNETVEPPPSTADTPPPFENTYDYYKKQFYNTENREVDNGPTKPTDSFGGY